MTHNFLSPLTGSFAMPAAENPTVAMIEAAYRHHGLDWRYLNCEVAPSALADAVRGARAMGWMGFNCSIPHKVAVIEHLDGLGESARIIGAVNTVVRVHPAGKRVVLLGAGGAARAVGVEMALAGAAEITIVNRSAGRGEEVAAIIDANTPAIGRYQPWMSRYVVPEGTDILINATSIGLFPDVEAMPDIDADSLRPDMVVADGIPNPPLTPFLRAAQRRGCRTADGLGMLVNQGIVAIRYWTGIDADAAVMRRALLDLGL